MFVSVFAELISLGAALPFIAVLAEPERCVQVSAGRQRGERSWHPGRRTSSFCRSRSVLRSLRSRAAGVRVLVTWASTRLSFGTGTELGLDIYRRTLYQPYETHISRSSSEVISGVASKSAPPC